MFLHQNKRILIADDSETMRMFIMFHLMKMFPGVELVEAVDGSDALEKLSQYEVDLILTDMNMPKLSGAEVIRSVRAMIKRAIPIIIITTRGALLDREQSLALGANGYITKPIDPGEFRETVLQYLG